VRGVWLSHHHPEHHDRCVSVAGAPICRRCLALWPLTYALLAVQVLLRVPGHGALDVLLPLVLTPPVLDFVEVHTGLRSYHPRRVWLLTPLLAVGLARLFFRYLVSPGDPVNWIVGAMVVGPCAWAVWRFQTRAYQEKSSHIPES
jgi:hypothetical protein